MKKILLAPDSAPGLPPAPASKPAPLSLDAIAADVKTIAAIIKKWKTATPTGQLHIAIGALGTAVEFADRHLKLAAAAPAATAAAK